MFYSVFVYIDTVLNGHLCFYKLEKWNSQYTYVSLRLRVQNAGPAEPCVGKY